MKNDFAKLDFVVRTRCRSDSIGNHWGHYPLPRCTSNLIMLNSRQGFVELYINTQREISLG